MMHVLAAPELLVKIASSHWGRLSAQTELLHTALLTVLQLSYMCCTCKEEKSTACPTPLHLLRKLGLQTLQQRVHVQQLERALVHRHKHQAQALHSVPGLVMGAINCTVLMNLPLMCTPGTQAHASLGIAVSGAIWAQLRRRSK